MLETRIGMKKMIVVTGATGHVGHLVVERLLSAGHSVRAVARNVEKLNSLGEHGAEVRPGSLMDRTFLTRVFCGADAAFVLTPADLSAPDVNAVQRKNIESTVAAIRDSGLKHVVLLSSWGAELTEPIGGIISSHLMEELLDDIPGLNVVHLRPVWFMENFLWNIPLIKMAGINGLAIRPDTLFPMVATCDIASVAANYLANLDFKGRNVHYLNGPRDYTMIEVTRILGASIGKPDLRYIEFPIPVMRKGLIRSGELSPNSADLVIQTNQGISSGRVKTELRSRSNTTPTTLEEFAMTKFAPAFKAAPNASFTEKFGGLFLRSFLFIAGKLSSLCQAPFILPMPSDKRSL